MHPRREVAEGCQYFHESRCKWQDVHKRTYERENEVIQTKREDLTILGYIRRKHSFETDGSGLQEQGVQIRCLRLPGRVPHDLHAEVSWLCQPIRDHPLHQHIGWRRTSRLTETRSYYRMPRNLVEEIVSGVGGILNTRRNEPGWGGCEE